MKTLSRILSTLCVLVIISGGEAFAQEENPNLPWTVLPRLLSLDPAPKRDLLEVLRREPNYGTCKSSVYDCLLRERPDATAVRIANLAAYVVSRGVPPNSVKVLIERRASFAQSTEFHRFGCENAPIYGNQRAQIMLTEFAEFKCPFCGTVSPLLKKLVDEAHLKDILNEEAERLGIAPPYRDWVYGGSS